MATEWPIGSAQGEAQRDTRRTRPGFWQRRYLLGHYRDFDDAALGCATDLPDWVVRGFLERHGATRSTGDIKRIEKQGKRPPPKMFTWAGARAVMTRLHSRPLQRVDAALIVALFAGSLALYAVTCARTVTGEDAGDFLSAAHGFGVPHPPGYPLWLLLAWTADHAVSWVSTAWRVAMVSAVSSAAADALFLALLLKTLRSRWAAVMAAVLFAVSRTHWTQAVIPEVYGLNTFFIAAQVLLVVLLAERPSAARLMALAGITGLSATNHTSALPVSLLVGLAAALIAPQLLRRPAVLAGSLLAGLAPLALYLMLPLASAHHPYDDWGHTSQPGGLWRHMTRAQYAEVEAEQVSMGNYDDYLHRLSIMADWGGKQFGSGWVLLLAALGVGTLFLRQTGVWLLLVALGWMNSVGITRYTAFPFEREHIYAVQIFWIPAWLSVAWFLGGGLDTVFGWVRRLQSDPVRRLGAAAAGAACCALVAIPAVHHFPIADRSRTTLIADFGKAILDAMEPNALYFPSSDHSTFSVMYWQGVERVRPDVVIADKYGRIEPELLEQFLTAQEREAEEHLPGRERRAFEESALIRHWQGPVYFANRREGGDLEGLTLEPVGPVFKVMNNAEREAWWRAGADGSPSAGLLASDRCGQLRDVDERQRLDFTVQMVHGDMLYMRGLAQLSAGDLPAALVTWQAIHGDLAPLKQALNNIGAALADAKRLPEAETFFERAQQEDPRYTLCLRNEALVCRNRGESDKAIDLLYKLVELDPRQRDSRMELARLLDQRERPIEALEQYEELAATDENDPVPWRAAAELLARRGDTKKASEAWSEVLRLVPDDPDAKRGLDHLAEAPMVMAPSSPMGLTATADEPDADPTPPAAAPPPAAQAPRGPIEQWGFDPERRPAVPPR